MSTALDRYAERLLGRLLLLKRRIGMRIPPQPIDARAGNDCDAGDSPDFTHWPAMSRHEGCVSAIPTISGFSMALPSCNFKNIESFVPRDSDRTFVFSGGQRQEARGSV